jgi:hypothetical protein
MQGQAEKKSDGSDRDQADEGFSGVSGVQCRENYGQQHRRRPETHPRSQSELGVAAQQEFFKEADCGEVSAPEDGELQNAHAVQRDRPQGKIAKASNGKYQ